jgi:hypothetical protein
MPRIRLGRRLTGLLAGTMLLGGLAAAGPLAATTAQASTAAPAVAASPARHAIAATGTVLRDGDGADLGIENDVHGEVVTTGGSEAFLEVDPTGSYFELEGQTNALCLTVDTSDSDIVLWEGCGGATSTLWTRSGELYKSDVTGEPLIAAPFGTCEAGVYGGLSSRGGQPAECSNEWNTVS